MSISALIFWIIGGSLVATGVTGIAYLVASESMWASEREHSAQWTYIAAFIAFGLLFASTSCMIGNRMF